MCWVWTFIKSDSTSALGPDRHETQMEKNCMICSSELLHLTSMSEHEMDSQCGISLELPALPASAPPQEDSVPSATAQSLWSPGRQEAVNDVPLGLRCQYWEAAVKEANIRSIFEKIHYLSVQGQV